MQETGKYVPERKISLALSMGSAGLYGAVAVAMGFANKATLQIFPMANTLLLLQMCAVIVVVGTLRVSGHAPIFNMDPSLFQQLSCHQKFHAMMLPHHNLSVYHLMRSPAGCSGQQRSCT